MMVSEPLKSSMIPGSAEDTSLALPSDNKLRMGKQRVLDQVHSIKRKPKPVTADSPTSPTLKALGTSAEFGKFKFLPSKATGTFRSSSIYTPSYNKSVFDRSRSQSAKTLGRKQIVSLSSWEQHTKSANWTQNSNGLKPSLSDPDLIHATVMSVKGQTAQGQQTLQSQSHRQSTHSMTNGSLAVGSQTRLMQPPSSQFISDNVDPVKTSKIQQKSVVNNSMTTQDLTLKEAVEFLSHPEESFQQCGATFIQHITFKEEHTKQEAFQLGAIPALVTLLRSSSPSVAQTAAGALRNLVFKDQTNKLEVQNCEGIAKALQLLKETDSTETQKQITGLLWNLSSADELKGELIVAALPALTENVVVPFTSWSENTINNNIHPDVFYNTTGCLRNLSCASLKERQAMRHCPDLIDSIMSYIQSCVAEDTPDDKSVENCACILHNLTYQLENESPQCFADFKSSEGDELADKKSSPVGCFSPKGSKAQKEFTFDVDQGLPFDNTPSGIKWLCHPKAMQTYLALLSSSQKNATQEACCGALQNLTASKGLGSTVMSHILVQKLGAMMHISPLLKSPNRNLQKTAVSLLGNLSRNRSLQTSIAKQILPELTRLLASGPREMGKCDGTIATAVNTMRGLMLSEPEITKKVMNNEIISSLADLSENGSFPKGSKAASLLLYCLWNEKNLQSIVKKLGISKSLFVNDNTTAAHKSVQVIE